MKTRIKFFSIIALIAIIALAVFACDNGNDDPETFTVTFDANGGTPAPQAQTVTKGGKVTTPPDMTKADSAFGGWYKESANTNQWNFAADTVTAHIMLYAKWGCGCPNGTVHLTGETCCENADCACQKNVNAVRKSVSELSAYLTAQNANTAAAPYHIALKIDNESDFTTLNTTLTTATTKYVFLYLYGSITTIPDEAFQFCETLAGITIPNSVTSIGEKAFLGCSNLTNIAIPNSVTSIGENAFTVTGLTSVTIPNSVTSIGDYAFFTDYLTAINVDVGNSAYSSENGILYNKNKTTLMCYPSAKTGTSFSIPNSVTSVGIYAFMYNYNLTSVTIPNSVTSIGEGAFYACYKLTSVTISNSVTSIGEFAFKNCSALTSVNFQGTIASTGFATDAFWGDLRTKFYQTNASGGTPGTYTTTSPVSDTSTWTKNP